MQGRWGGIRLIFALKHLFLNGTVGRRRPYLHTLAVKNASNKRYNRASLSNICAPAGESCVEVNGNDSEEKDSHYRRNRAAGACRRRFHHPQEERGRGDGTDRQGLAAESDIGSFCLG